MHEDDLDSLIDQALSSYGAEPSLALETKIIAESRSAPMLVRKKASVRWLSMASGVAAAAALTILLIHFEMRGPVVGGHPIAADQQSASGRYKAGYEQTSSPVSRRAPLKKHPRLHGKTKKATASGSPMTEQEEMLVALVTQHPSEARQWLSSDARKSEPLRIEPLSIPPISTEPLKIAALQVDPLQ